MAWASYLSLWALNWGTGARVLDELWWNPKPACLSGLLRFSLQQGSHCPNSQLHGLLSLILSLSERALCGQNSQGQAQMDLRETEDVLHSWPTCQAIFDDYCMVICTLSKAGALQSPHVSWRSSCTPSHSREASNEIYWESLLLGLDTMYYIYNFVVVVVCFYLTETLVYRGKKITKCLNSKDPFLFPPSLLPSLSSPPLSCMESSGILCPRNRDTTMNNTEMVLHPWSSQPSQKIDKNK